MYVNSHFAITTVTLAWLYLRRNERFYFVRNMFMVAMGIALVGYMAVPTAPPRFMPELGFTDSVAAFTGVNHDTGSTGVLFNPFAAIPSMHVAFALMLGLTMAQLVRRRWAKVLWWSYAPMVTFVVIATANHWWFDAFLGAAVAAVSAVAAHGLFARARPEVWAWNAAPRHQACCGKLSQHRISFAAMSSPRVERPPRPTAREYQALMRNRLITSRLTPNAISLTGLALCVVAAVLVWQEEFLLGGIAFIVGSVCDTLDGRYSRMSGKGSPFGAFLDSTLDRMEEGIVLTAVAVYFSKQGDDLAVAAVVVAVLASLMVSYTRARAEALGVECKVGIADRAVRVVILSAGLVLADLDVLDIAVYVLAGLSAITVFQRIWHVRGELTRAAVDL